MSQTPRMGMTFSFVVASLSFVMVFVTAGSPIPLFNIYQSEHGVSNKAKGSRFFL